MSFNQDILQEARRNSQQQQPQQQQQLPQQSFQNYQQPPLSGGGFQPYSSNPSMLMPSGGGYNPNLHAAAQQELNRQQQMAIQEEARRQLEAQRQQMRQAQAQQQMAEERMRQAEAQRLQVLQEKKAQLEQARQQAIMEEQRRRQEQALAQQRAMQEQVRQQQLSQEKAQRANQLDAMLKMAAAQEMNVVHSSVAQKRSEEEARMRQQEQERNSKAAELGRRIAEENARKQAEEEAILRQQLLVQQQMQQAEIQRQAALLAEQQRMAAERAAMEQAIREEAAMAQRAQQAAQEALRKEQEAIKAQQEIEEKASLHLRKMEAFKQNQSAQAQQATEKERQEREARAAHAESVRRIAIQQQDYSNEFNAQVLAQQEEQLKQRTQAALEAAATEHQIFTQQQQEIAEKVKEGRAILQKAQLQAQAQHQAIVQQQQAIAQQMALAQASEQMQQQQQLAEKQRQLEAHQKQQADAIQRQMQEYQQQEAELARQHQEAQKQAALQEQNARELQQSYLQQHAAIAAQQRQVAEIQQQQQQSQPDLFSSASGLFTQTAPAIQAEPAPLSAPAASTPLASTPVPAPVVDELDAFEAAMRDDAMEAAEASFFSAPLTVTPSAAPVSVSPPSSNSSPPSASQHGELQEWAQFPEQRAPVAVDPGPTEAEIRAQIEAEAQNQLASERSRIEEEVRAKLEKETSENFVPKPSGPTTFSPFDGMESQSPAANSAFPAFGNAFDFQTRSIDMKPPPAARSVRKSPMRSSESEPAPESKPKRSAPPPPQPTRSASPPPEPTRSAPPPPQPKLVLMKPVIEEDSGESVEEVAVSAVFVPPPAPVRKAPAPPPPQTPFDDDEDDEVEVAVVPLPKRSAPPPPPPTGSSKRSPPPPPPVFQERPPVPKPPTSDASEPSTSVIADTERHQLVNTLSGLGDLGGLFGGSSEEEGDDHHMDGDEENYEENLSPMHSNGMLSAPTDADLKLKEQVLQADWYEEKSNYSGRLAARDAFGKDRELLRSIDFSQVEDYVSDEWRAVILTQLLNSKQLFLTELAVFRKLFLPSLTGTKKVKQQAKDSIFSELNEQTSELFHRHKALLAQLLEKQHSFYETGAFADLATKFASYASKIDVKYVERMPSYLAAFMYHCSSTKFSAWLKTVEGKPEAAPVGDMLKSLLRHIMEVYQLFQDLLLCTRTTHPDYALLQKALMVMLAVTEKIEAADSELEKHKAVAEIDPCLKPSLKDFYSHSRKLERKEKLLHFVKEKKKLVREDVTAMLFNDLVLVTTEEPSKEYGGVRYRIQVHVDLSNIASVVSGRNITEKTSLDPAQEQMVDLGFMLVSKKDKKVLLFALTEEQRDGWVNTLSEILRSARTAALQKKANKK